MSESKYQSQIKNLRKNYVRFPLDLKPDVLEAFRAACEKNGTKATTEIKKFINQYIEDNQSCTASRRVKPAVFFYTAKPPRLERPAERRFNMP